MDDILARIALCVESGKTDKASPYPPGMKGQDGADEITKLAIEEGLGPARILDEALIPAMAAVGERFSRKEIYVPQMLMAAKAMNSSMKHLKPFFQSGETKRKGKFIIGTVSGDPSGLRGDFAQDARKAGSIAAAPLAAAVFRKSRRSIGPPPGR